MRPHMTLLFASTLRASAGLLGLVLCSAMACDSAPKTPSEQANPPAAAIPSAPAATAATGDAAAASGEAAPTGAAAASGEAAPTGAPSPSGDTQAVEANAKDDGGDQADDPEAPDDEAADVEPRRVLLIGDSLVATGFGVLLEKGLDAHPEVTCFRKGKSASGLARPDFFDWMGEAKRQIEYRKPEVVVAIMGGNDGQDLRPKSGKGRGVAWPSDAWNAGYRERMDALLAQLSADGRKVIWVALPPMGMRSLEKKLVTIRAIQKEAVEALGDQGVYIETAAFLTDDEGKLKTYGVVKGKKREIRADDGIHFTMSGSEYLANLVVPELLNELGVSAVED